MHFWRPSRRGKKAAERQRRPGSIACRPLGALVDVARTPDTSFRPVHSDELTFLHFVLCTRRCTWRLVVCFLQFCIARLFAVGTAFRNRARRHVMVRLGDSFTSTVINNQELRNKRSNRKHKIQNTDSVLRPSPSWTRTLWLSSVGSDDTTGGTFRFFTIWVTSGVNWAEIERSTGPSSLVPPLILSNIFELVTC